MQINSSSYGGKHISQVGNTLVSRSQTAFSVFLCGGATTKTGKSGLAGEETRIPNDMLLLGL